MKAPGPWMLRSTWLSAAKWITAWLEEFSGEVAALPAGGDAEAQWWTHALLLQCLAVREDLEFLVEQTLRLGRELSGGYG